MQIFASIRGTFIEPVDEHQHTTDDLVSFLQFEAHSAEETQVLRNVYRVMQHGGALRVRRDVHGFFLSADPMTASSSSSTASGDEGTSLPNTDTQISSRRDKLAPFPLLSPEGTDTSLEPVPVHRHAFSANEGHVYEKEGSWLKCTCGDWEYFARRRPGSLTKKTPKTKIN